MSLPRTTWGFDLARRARDALSELHPWDAAGLSLATILGGASLYYPFGRDQGLYHYVGREWFRGSLPYRDTMEQKTPLIYLIYGLANKLFGERFVSIRILELVFVLLVGWSLAHLAAPAHRSPLPGLRGASVLATVVAYFGGLNYWDTAQCEVWMIGFTLLSLTVVERVDPTPRSAMGAGVLAGLAVLAKPPALLLVFVVGLIAVERAIRATPVGHRRVRGAALAASLFVAGALIPGVLVLAQLTLGGAFGDTWDILVRLNLGYYNRAEADVESTREAVGKIKDWFRGRSPFGYLPVAVSALGVLAGAISRSWALTRRYAILAALLALALAGIGVQRKFYCGYHWGTILLLLAASFALVADDVCRRAPSWLRWKGASPHVAAALTMLYLVAYSRSGAAYTDSRRTFASVVAYARGRLPRERFLRGLEIPRHDLVAQEVIGAWIAAHSRPDDYVAMRNFEAPMYLVARRRSPSRFFWTPWLAWPRRSYRRAEWLAQDEAQMRRNPPRFLVAVRRLYEGVESPVTYQPEYEPRLLHGDFVVMERVGTRLDAPANVAYLRDRRLVAVQTLGTFDDTAAGMAGWQTTGDAFERQPCTTARPGQTPILRAGGRGFLNTFHPERGDATTGTAVSPTFSGGAGRHLFFMVGGGSGFGTRVELLADGEVVGVWGGLENEQLRVITRDLGAYAGRSLRVRIVDDDTEPWGHILADHFVVMEAPR